MAAAKRRSVSNDLGDGGAGGKRAVDPLFEFDAPQLFVDLTRAHRYLASSASGGALPPHDPWFDEVHDAHSKPSYELAQEEAEVQQQHKSHHHHHHHHHYVQQASSSAAAHHSHRHSGNTTNAPNATGKSTSAVDSRASHRRPGATASGLRSRASAGSASALNPSAALEKENRIVGPKRRATVFATGLSSSSAGSSGGLANSANAPASSSGGALATPSSSANQQPQQGVRSAPSATVSGLPARLRRRSAAGPDSSSADTTEPSASGSVERMRMQIKTATVAAPVDSIAALRVDSAIGRPSDDLRSSARASASSVTTPQARSASAMASARASRLQKPRERTARFMAPTASSRIAAAHAQAVADEQRAASARPKAKAAVRRPAPSASSTSGSGATSDLQDLQDLLARHNKKFKATHTYQPPQHSVRDVRMWEKKTQQSYYDLSPDARVRANSEIAQLVKLAGATTPTSR